jgi:hypothetical protein
MMTEKQKQENPHAVELAKLRAASLTKERRQEIARSGGKAKAKRAKQRKCQHGGIENE